MNLSANILQRISTSTILTPEQKETFFQALPLLNRDQQIELLLILSGGDERTSLIQQGTERLLSFENVQFLKKFETESKKILKRSFEEYETQEKETVEDYLKKLSDI